MWCCNNVCFGYVYIVDVPFFLGENQTEELCIMTSGKLMYSLSWTVNDKGIPLAPTIQHAFISSNR